MLLPIEGQKVEGIGSGPLEEGVRDGEQEPAGPYYGVNSGTSWGMIMI